MNRRAFITLLGGAAVAWPVAVRAQSERVRRIGVLMGVADDQEGQARLAALKKALQELGWTDGRNIQIETRFGGGDAGRIRAHAAELVALRRRPRSFSITRMAFSRAAARSSLAWIALSIATISRTLVEGT